LIEKPLLVMGNESTGIPRDFMRKVCSAMPDACVISIPQWSVLRSLNIASAATIAMWELRSKNKFESLI
jgi:tRNA(Leu) C34 or U34 (ribose-2'-O)-methylase TrmL